MSDALKSILTLKSRIKASIDRIVVWFKNSLLGRIIWIVANSRKDFKTVLPVYEFKLTEEQAKYFETQFVAHGLGALRYFYIKYPRGAFNLPPQGGPLEIETECAKLMEAACDALYLEVTPEGKRLYIAGNPFFRKMGELAQAIGAMTPRRMPAGVDYRGAPR
jgi:hypothetical protein